MRSVEKKKSSSNCKTDQEEEEGERSWEKEERWASKPFSTSRPTQCALTFFFLFAWKVSMKLLNLTLAIFCSKLQSILQIISFLFLILVVRLNPQGLLACPHVGRRLGRFVQDYWVSCAPHHHCHHCHLAIHDMREHANPHHNITLTLRVTLQFFHWTWIGFKMMSISRWIWEEYVTNGLQGSTRLVGIP